MTDRPYLIEEQQAAEERREQARRTRETHQRIKSDAFRKRLHIDRRTRTCPRHGRIETPEDPSSRPRYTCEQCFAEAYAEIGGIWTERPPGSAGPNVSERAPANLGRLGDMRGGPGIRQGSVRE